MKKLNPYLNFNGNTREAMTYYKEALGGELSILTVGESPMRDQMPSEAASSVMHSCLSSGEFTLMASDMSPQEGAGRNGGIVIDCASDEEQKRLFAHFSAGGTVTCPLSPAFWGGTFGATTDKFGITWLFNFGSDGS